MKQIKALFVKSRVKEKVKAAGLRIGNAALEELEKVASEELDKAIRRTKMNNRKTIKPQDVI